MAELDSLLVLAQRVAQEAEALGIKTAMIGALAMAHYGYVRATVDVDFASATTFDVKLRALADRLSAGGLTVELRAPGDDDPLCGVLRVRAVPGGDPVDVVNFPPSGSLGTLAVERAQPSADGFTYVRLPELVALKLYAGSRFDRDDVKRLLSEAEDVDLEELRRVCQQVGLGEDLEGLIAEG